VTRRRRPAALGLILAGLALVWSSLLGPGVTPARAAPAPFADFGVWDVVATPDRMLALICVDVPETPSTQDTRLALVSVSASGAKSLFAAIPEDCTPHVSVAISPGAGGIKGFPAGEIYVSAHSTVYRVVPDAGSPGGNRAEIFAVVPAGEARLELEHVMAFDDVGDFGYDMLLAGSYGSVYRITSLGGTAVQFATITEIASDNCIRTVGVGALGHDIDVAPKDFGSLGGQLMVPTSCFHKSGVYAVSPIGIVTIAADFSTIRQLPWSLSFVPQRLCTFSSTMGTFFMEANVPFGSTQPKSKLMKFPPADFGGKSGVPVVALIGEDAGPNDARLVALRPDGSITPFQSNFDGRNSGGFVECPPPQRAVSVADVTVPEGDAGVTTANVDITLPSPSDQEVRVRWATADGTATAGSDYNAASGAVSFAPGETAKTVGVEVVGDPTPEPNEAFTVSLEPVLNASLARGQAAVTIADDDASPVVSGLVPDSGPVAGGTRVALTGTRLGGTKVVRFGPVDVAAHPCPAGGGTGRAPCFTEESPTRLSVYSPAAPAPGVVHVLVTTASGSSLPTAADVFTYVDERAAPQAADPPPAPVAEPPPAAPPGHVAPPPPAPPGGAPTPPGTPSVGPGPGPGPAQAPSPTPGQVQAPSPTPGQAQAPGSASAPAPGGSPGAQVGLGAAPAATPEAAVRHAMVRRPQADPTTAAGGAALVVFGCLLMASADRADQARRCAPAVSC